MSVQKLKDEAARALGRKDVKYLIGHKKGSYGFRVSPAFIEPKEDIDQLTFSPLCNMSLVKYVMMEEALPSLTEQAMKPSKIALVARGCDSRAINLLIEEKGVPRDKLYIIVTFSPDGSILASGGSWVINLWEVSDGTLLNTLTGYGNYVESVAFSPDGTTLASGSFDQTIRLWRASDGVLLKTMKEHTGFVNGISFSPDGSILASGGLDGRLLLWGVP